MSSTGKQPRDEPSRVTGVVSYVISPNCRGHIEWLKRVFKCTLGVVKWADNGQPLMDEPDDVEPKEGWKVMHAELHINGGMLYISDRISEDSYPEICVNQADIEGNKGRGIMMYADVGDDVHGVWGRAVEEKATVRVQLEKRFWGAWYGVFIDPYGFEWAIAKQEPMSENEVRN